MPADPLAGSATLARASLFVGDARRMVEVSDGAVHLVVTSPPYWHLKDYGCPGQIGSGQSLHDYLRSLEETWRECRRALAEGGRLCINVGDQFARASRYGRYRVIPIHAEIVAQCCGLGFDYLGAIIWRKKTTVRTSGGAVVMGSFPYPPNGIVELDHEYILLFRLPGPGRKIPLELKRAAALSKEEWKRFFAGSWEFAGARKSGHEAPFPEELPRRLIRMFSLPGDTVLDPFLGTGTTAVVALALGRNAIGYEINGEYGHAAAQRCRGQGLFAEVRIQRSTGAEQVGNRSDASETPHYVPRIPDLSPPSAPEPGGPELRVVTTVREDGTLELDSGERVAFLGLKDTGNRKAIAYLNSRLLRKRVFLKDVQPARAGTVAAYVYLANRISVNAHLVRSGLADADPSLSHRLAAKFANLAAAAGVQAGPGGREESRERN